MICSSDLIAFHDSLAPRAAGAIWDALETNHRQNRLLWEQEDLARRRNVPDAEIASNKRAIDAYNQKRNDAIERLDELLLALLQGTKKSPDAKLNSESAGAIIDRLSILALKIRSMRLQTDRADVDEAHIDACARKLERLLEQRADLGACLDRLFAEAVSGQSYFKVYRQFKMYNDAALNPALYGETRARKA
jgi:hypothetical protein